MARARELRAERGATDAKGHLLRVLADADESGEGLLPRGVFLEVLGAQRFAGYAEALIDFFGTPPGGRVRYRDFVEWLYSEEDADGPPGLAGVLERARELHAERSADEAARLQSGEPTGAFGASREQWFMRDWLQGRPCETVAEALAAPLAADAGMEFEFVQALGKLGGERAKKVVMGLLRSGNVLEKLVDVIVALLKETAQAKAGEHQQPPRKNAYTTTLRVIRRLWGGGGGTNVSLNQSQ